MTYTATPEIEHAASEYHRLRKDRSKFTGSLDDYRKKEALAKAALDQLLSYFSDDLEMIGLDTYIYTGDNLSVDELAGQVDRLKELKRLLKGWGNVHAVDFTLRDLVKNRRTRESLLRKWGKDLPSQTRWKDDGYSTYRRVGEEGKILRVWAKEQGFTFKQGETIPPQIVDAYVVAHEDKWDDADVLEHPDGVGIKVWVYASATIEQHGDELGARGYRAHGHRISHAQTPEALEGGYFISDYTPLSKWETPEMIEAKKRRDESERRRCIEWHREYEAKKLAESQ